MRSVKYLIAAGAASLLSTAALAADMPSIMPPPPAYYAPPVVEDFGGWYLRGDIGQTNTRGKLYAPGYDDLSTASYTQIGHEFSGGTSVGIGVGYQFNGWLRADITGEYRSKIKFSGTDFVTGSNGFNYSDSYNGGYYSFVGLFNLYADLGTWWCITPFIGVGIGGAHNTFSGLQDAGISPLPIFNQTGPGISQYVNTPTMYQANAGSKTNFAYALHAGLAYKVSNNFTVELAYRYLNMGEGITGTGTTFDATKTKGRAFQFQDLTSQDIRLGMRWNLDSGSYLPPPPPPLIRKG
ncbi:MAG: hypothetical protein JWR73_1033 [Tardiphaga sp.]|nr:hypothetical protein [Tardiphaga sp.]MDB5625231.1 hypothetical protein [Tardiphaga sp.]MDB5631073.1 hypothetical protein [Tardiphaga sp.]